MTKSSSVALKCPLGWGTAPVLLLEAETGGSLELAGQPARPNQCALDFVKNTSLKKNTLESNREATCM